MKWFEPTVEQLAEWQVWLEDRPQHVRDIAERFNPWTLYKLSTTGQRCSVIGFHEGAANCGETDVDPMRVTAYIHAENPVLGEVSACNVFGIDPDMLVLWTAEDEIVSSTGLLSTFGDQRFPEDPEVR